MNKLNQDAIMRAAELMCSDSPPWSPAIAEKVGRLLAVEADCPHEHTVAIQLAHAIVDAEMGEPGPAAETATCGAYSRFERLGATLGPYTRLPGHVNHKDVVEPTWHCDASGAAWAPDDPESLTLAAARADASTPARFSKH